MVFALKDAKPTAVLLLAEVFLLNAPEPTAVLEEPTHTSKAVAPIAVLLCSTTAASKA